MSKNAAKKPVFGKLVVRFSRYDVCPSCGDSVYSFGGNYCSECGQLLDLSGSLFQDLKIDLDNEALSVFRRYAELPGGETPSLIDPFAIGHVLDHLNLREEVTGND